MKRTTIQRRLCHVLELFSNVMKTVVKWNEHFTESAIFPLRQCCIYKVGKPIVEFSGVYIEVID